MKTYSLIENGTVHTKGLDLEDANEMLERHSRIFDTIHWEIRPEQENDIEAEGFLERHRRIAINYFAV